MALAYVGHARGVVAIRTGNSHRTAQRSIAEATATLDAHGVRYKGPIDRGYERSLYFRDPNGAVVELMSWITPVPDGVDEGDLIVAAQQRRVARKACFVENEDVKAVLAQQS